MRAQDANLKTTLYVYNGIKFFHRLDKSNVADLDLVGSVPFWADPDLDPDV
jgi:hypothetical protein